MSPINIFQDIKIESQPNIPPVFISQSICNYMNDIKSKISCREKEWDFYKKYTNPYEYIHTVVPQKKKSVSKYKPISRSYFKMLEMMSEFCLDYPADQTFQNMSYSSFFFADRMRTFHLAEGPGGFIEAICNKRDNPADEYYGMTIILDKNDDNVPAWHKTGHFLSQHPNVNLEYGLDGTGNLLHIDNFEYCVKKYGSSMDLITADGGFDFSKNFNMQEISITNLLWGQVCYALCLQKMGGNFVLKIFDVFYRPTVDILYILSGFYEEVNICKLKTSRVGNSEKYVVCKKFRFSSCFSFYPKIYESFLNIKSEWNEFSIADFLRIDEPRNSYIATAVENGQNQPEYIWQILNFDIPRHFTKTIEEINAIFGQQQIENIHYTISLIDKQPKQDKLDQLVKQNITKCVNWCIEHSVIYNNLVAVNMFGIVPSSSLKSNLDAIGVGDGMMRCDGVR